MKTLTIPRTSDFHTHLRSIAQVGRRCFHWLVRMNCSYYRYVIVEPNAFLDKSDPKHHIETVDDLVRYREEVMDALPADSRCTPLFLIKLTPKTTPSVIRDAAHAGCVGLKIYPEGVTTGSHHGGVTDFFSKQMYRCLECAQELDLALQEHPEMPHTFCLHREWVYHQVLERHARDFPRLRLFVEHVSDRRTLALVHKLREKYGARVYATLTGHHQRMTLDDVIGRVDGYCAPCAKEPSDKDVISRAAMSGSEYIISITDSAFWKYRMKHLTECACAGIFNPAHVAIPALVGEFEEKNCIDKLKPFTSGSGLAAYGLDQEETDVVSLVKQTWKVPKRYDTGSGTVTPFLAGQNLKWKMAD